MLLRYLYSIIILVAIFCSSCETYEPLFQANAAQKVKKFGTSQDAEPTIRIGDKVIVSVWGHDELSVGSINTPYTTNESTGRFVIVDETGEINLPRIGRVKLVGYSTKEATYFLERIYERNGIKAPIVNVRVLNHFITLLGEIKSPGRYQINNEPYTLIALIAQAQGLTEYAKADDIKIIRTLENGEKEEVTVNLMRFESLTEQNFILKPDDLVYIPPSKMKRFDIVLEKVTPIAGVLTSIAVIFSVFR
jgi:polysaccharide export outer membrane protein